MWRDPSLCLAGASRKSCPQNAPRRSLSARWMLQTTTALTLPCSRLVRYNSLVLSAWTVHRVKRCRPSPVNGPHANRKVRKRSVQVKARMCCSSLQTIRCAWVSFIRHSSITVAPQAFAQSQAHLPLLRIQMRPWESTGRMACLAVWLAMSIQCGLQDSSDLNVMLDVPA